MTDSPSPIGRKPGMERRSFLKLSGMLGLGLASSCTMPLSGTSLRNGAAKLGGGRHTVSRTDVAMGTFVSMTLVHDSVDQAEEAMALAYEEIDRLTRILSRFDEGTALSRLNRRGVLEEAPPELVVLFTTAGTPGVVSEVKEVDAITGASEPADTGTVAKKIVDKVRPILAR